MTVEAIYENGVFRPTDKVDLPDHTRVMFEPRPVDTDEPVEPRGPISPGLAVIYEVMGRSYDDLPPDLGALHNEHQP